MDAKAIFDFLNSAGVLGFALLVIVAFLRGWVHTSREFDGVVKDRDEWKELALRGTRIADRAMQVGERRVANRAPGNDERRRNDD